MITKIIKRDGREAPFNIEKIANAIFKAIQMTGGRDYDTAMDLACKVAEVVEADCRKSETIPTVEQIQDVVERVLIDNGHARTAKEYILYRADRTRIREMNTSLMKTYEDMTFIRGDGNAIRTDTEPVMGMMFRYGSEGAKKFNELYVIDPKASYAHCDGDIHIHNMDFYTLTTSSCQLDLEKLFSGGFSTGYGYLREPNDITSYGALACIAIQENQNDQNGSQSIPDFDYCMAPGVKKTYRKHFRKNLAKALELLCDIEDSDIFASAVLDECGVEPALNMSDEQLYKIATKVADTVPEEQARRTVEFAAKHARTETKRTTYQAMEAFIHNLNTLHTRAGAAIPLSTINYGLDTSPEGRLIMKCLLSATDRGLGRGETPLYPVQIFKVKEGVNYNHGDPNYDLFRLSCRVSAKRLYPDFCFLDAPFNKMFYKENNRSTEIAYGGEGIRVISNFGDPNRQFVAGRGNLCYTSINLPRLAITSGGDTDRFFEMLDTTFSLIIKQLISRFEILCQKKVRNFPFLMGQALWLDSEKLSPDDTVGEVLKHGSLSVGFVGLAEALISLTGHHHGEDNDAKNLGQEIVGFMRRRADEATAKNGLNITLIATPSGEVAHRFAKRDREKFGVIAGVNDREKYTDSFAVPDDADITPEARIETEAPYHSLTNGGHFTRVFFNGNPLDSLDEFENLVRKMKETGIGCGTVDHPVDRDPVCGYTGIITDKCPCCGRTEKEDKIPFEHIRRTGNGLMLINGGTSEFKG